MLFRLAYSSFFAVAATAAPANDAQSPGHPSDRAPLLSCSERFATPPDLLVRGVAYRATESPTPFMPPGQYFDYTMTLDFRVTNAANATEWRCGTGEGAVFPKELSPYPTAPDQNVMDPQAVVDDCYSREDPNTSDGWWHPDRPRRATWFRFDKEADNTLVVGQTVHCIDEDGQKSTYEIQGEKQLPLECTFEDHPEYIAYVCDPVDTTIPTHFV